jgi:hypothetical protein
VRGLTVAADPNPHGAARNERTRRLEPHRAASFWRILRLADRSANPSWQSFRDGVPLAGARTRRRSSPLKHVTLRSRIATTRTTLAFTDSDSAALAVSCRFTASAVPGCRDHVDVVAGRRRRNSEQRDAERAARTPPRSG